MLTPETKDRLYCLTDGETDRKNWVVDQINSYRDNPAFELVKDGDWSDYEHCPEFKIADGHTLTPADINLRYHEFASNAWPVFDRVRQQVGHTSLKMQVGVPTAFDMSLFTLGAERGMDEQAIEAFSQATLEQIEAINNEPFGSDVVYQLETPASLSIALQVDDAGFRRGLAKRITDFVARAPENTEYGVHLCVGDLGNEARQQPQDRKASVELMNFMAEMWPEGRRLAYVHDPVAAGHEVPMFDKQAYASLADLQLPEGTRYIAGIAHEDQPLDRQRKVLRIIRETLPEGQLLGVAAGCGLGRRSPEDAQRVDQRQAELSDPAAN